MTARCAPAENDHLLFWCPGCETAHQIRYHDGGWTWDRSIERPTVTPSVLVQGGSDGVVCHSFVTDGRIEFLDDSTHSLAGTTVDLPTWPPTFERVES